MKIVESFARKFAKSASTEVKKELKKTLIDLLPGVLTIATTIFGIVIFKGNSGGCSELEYDRPLRSTTTITNNNYFFNQEVSDETILRLMFNDDD